VAGLNYSESRTRRGAAVRRSQIKVGFKGMVSSLDENLCDMAYAKDARGFAFEKGVLTANFGVEDASGFYFSPIYLRHAYPALPEGKKLKDVFLYRHTNSKGRCDDRIVAQLTSGEFMYTAVFDNDTWHALTGIRTTAEVSAVNYNYQGNEVLLLATPLNNLWLINDATMYNCSASPQFSSMTVHNERVYGSINGIEKQVWFSDNFNPLNWTVSSTEAGFINFSDDCGEILKVVSFLNYLYVFREYGIFRITAFGDQSEFLVKKIFTDTGRIIKKTIEVCGDRIIFYAENGLFSFDGYDVTPIFKELGDVYNNGIMCGAYLNGCYYLACCESDTTTKTDTLYKCDFLDKTLSKISGLNVISLRAINVSNGSQMLCVLKNATKIGEIGGSGAVFDKCTEKKYVSPSSDLSIPSLKIIRDFSLITHYPLTVRVILDGTAYEYSLKGSTELQKIPVEKSGYIVGFELETTEPKAYVTPLKVSVERM